MTSDWNKAGLMLRAVRQSDLPLLEHWLNDHDTRLRMDGLQPLSQWFGYYDSSQGRIFAWIGYAQEQPIGMIIVETEEEAGYIAMMVNPALRNRGFGKRLLKEAMNHPGLSHLQRWEAGIEADNQASIACFRALQFTADKAEPDEDGFISYIYDGSCV
ncbi:GNAT family N-acetyltransferase [Paenibacillus pinisoli]|uniref:GNAT family N-acetyltransferase n=1 Tax=Paenibacillus pinisoli TaxID=1276110 RepID=A0A3A6PD93_9BACL|nr:GNAT family N-acetyltransferase [Paenibacillus pinisoli]RJX38020.1 GNAT family N-acetyltransferase [Paenibacillus pinisoli]